MRRSFLREPGRLPVRHRSHQGAGRRRGETGSAVSDDVSAGARRRRLRAGGSLLSRSVSVKFTPDEVAEIDEAAGRQRVTRARYIAAAALDAAHGAAMSPAAERRAFMRALVDVSRALKAAVSAAGSPARDDGALAAKLVRAADAAEETAVGIGQALR